MSQETLGFDAAQWAALKRGPLYMLACVGAADARIDTAEWSALLDAIVASADADDALVRGVMRSLAEDLRAGREVKLENRDPFAALIEIRDIVGPWSDTGQGLRTTLMEIGATIAESSGSQLRMTYTTRREAGGGWRLASGTSTAEHSALEAAAEALNLAVAREDTAEGASAEPIAP
jgi:hypothetical protein